MSRARRALSAGAVPCSYCGRPVLQFKTAGNAEVLLEVPKLLLHNCRAAVKKEVRRRPSPHSPVKETPTPTSPASDTSRGLQPAPAKGGGAPAAHANRPTPRAAQTGQKTQRPLRWELFDGYYARCAYCKQPVAVVRRPRPEVVSLLELDRSADHRCDRTATTRLAEARVRFWDAVRVRLAEHDAARAKQRNLITENQGDARLNGSAIRQSQEGPHQGSKRPSKKRQRNARRARSHDDNVGATRLVRVRSIPGNRRDCPNCGHLRAGPMDDLYCPHCSA